MAPTLDQVTKKTEMLEIDPKNIKAEIITEEGVVVQQPKSSSSSSTTTNEQAVEEKETREQERTKPTNEEPNKETSSEEKPAVAAYSNEPKKDVVVAKDEMKKEEKVEVQIEPKTGVSFPVKLDDGKQLNSFGIRNKKILGLGIKIYAFGMFADNEKLKEVVKMKIGKAPAKPTKEMYQVVIDNDIAMMVRLVIVFGGLTMNMVKKNFDEGLGASIKKLNGGRKNDELTNKVMGEASDNIKLGAGSVIEITRLPGNILQTKVKDEVVSKVQSELLCRAYFHMYLGDDAFDKDAKERFGNSLLSLF